MKAVRGSVTTEEIRPGWVSHKYPILGLTDVASQTSARGETQEILAVTDYKPGQAITHMHLAGLSSHWRELETRDTASIVEVNINTFIVQTFGGPALHLKQSKQNKT